jgi:hypothetical protein
MGEGRRLTKIGSLAADADQQVYLLGFQRYRLVDLLRHIIRS